MEKQCRQCSTPFDVTDDDLLLLGKLVPRVGNEVISIPAPTLCPDCRQQRRQVFRNEHTLYKRKCDATGKEMISIYPPMTNYTVYSQEAWYGDTWDAKEQGRDFDFNKPLFTQLKELFVRIPQIGLLVFSNENSDYVNMTGYCKNCYLNIACEYNEDCYYMDRSIKCRSCVDCMETFNSELCYSCVDTYDSYQLLYSELCRNCSESAFLYNCIGCNNCLLCTNLRDRSYCYMNEQLPKEEYFEKYNEFFKTIEDDFIKHRNSFDQLKKESIKKYTNNLQTERCIGDHIFRSKNCKYCFDLENSEDCKYCYSGFSVKDSLDLSNATESELCYEASAIGFGSMYILFSVGVWAASYNVMYSMTCKSCHDIFGCAGLKNEEYCILNKQYSKQDYNQLLKKILSYCKTTEEFGEFFPMNMSPFAYNESVAQDYFPLKKEQAAILGARWRHMDTTEYKEQTYVIPDTIADVKEDICDALLACRRCRKNYRIIRPELAFYKDHNIPIPTKCPTCRYLKRLSLRNERKLYERTCDNCHIELISPYPKEKEAHIYCNECYLECNN